VLYGALGGDLTEIQSKGITSEILAVCLLATCDVLSAWVSCGVPEGLL
jgi:hypothetical protein